MNNNNTHAKILSLNLLKQTKLVLYLHNSRLIFDGKRNSVWCTNQLTKGNYNPKLALVNKIQTRFFCVSSNDGSLERSPVASSIAQIVAKGYLGACNWFLFFMFSILLPFRFVVYFILFSRNKLFHCFVLLWFQR